MTSGCRVTRLATFPREFEPPSYQRDEPSRLENAGPGVRPDRQVLAGVLGVFDPFLGLIEVTVTQERQNRLDRGLGGFAGFVAHADLAGLHQPEHGGELPWRGR